jgi:hypothetical protein
LRDPNGPEPVEGGLRLNYLKYQSVITAHSALGRMVREGKWQGKKPTDTDIIEMVVSRSMWYSHYKKVFSRVAQFPDMQKWLKEEDGAPTDYEIWGEEGKVHFTFKDLALWLDDSINKAKRGGRKKKEKGKEKVKEKVKEKEKEEEEEEEEEDKRKRSRKGGKSRKN